MSFKSWNLDMVRKHNERVSKNNLAAAPGVDQAAHTSSGGVAKSLPAGKSGNVRSISKRKPAYTEAQVIEWCKRYRLPSPLFEYKFHPERKWRMDIAWTKDVLRCSEYWTSIFIPQPIFLEVQGGIWITGGHSRGAQMKKDWEKWIAAQAMGWRVAWCEPKDLLTESTANIIKELLK